MIVLKIIKIFGYSFLVVRYQTEENGKIIHFVFDKEQNLSVEEGETTHRIIRGHEPVTRQNEEDNHYQYYTQDEQKSTMYLLDEHQQITNAYRYDAFGNLLEKEEEGINRLLYTGQMYDEAMGQYYLRARYYSPTVGRFLQEDVYRGDGLNLYAYCGNHPVRYYDPSGYMKICSDLPSGGNAKGGENAGDNWLLSSKGKVDPKSTPNFGHTFSEHGEGSKNTKALTDRAKGGQEQGQWINNQKTAEYLNDYGTIPHSTPPVEIEIPKGLGQVIMPNGSIVSTNKARVVTNKKTGKIRTAFPIL